MSSEHERAVLGAILGYKPELYDSLGLVESDFSDPVNRAIWRTIGETIEDKCHPDIVTVGSRMNGHAAVVAGLVDGGNIVNAAYNAGKVKEAAQQRRVEQAIPRLKDAAVKGCDAFLAEIDSIQAELSGSQQNNPRELWRVLVATTELLATRADTADGIVGISCGFPSIDFWTKGFQDGDLVIVAARTSVGKTALALSMARRMKVPVGLFSLEMTAEQIGERMIGMEAKIQTLSVKRSDLPKVVDAGAEISRRSKIYIDDSANMTLAQIRSKARWMHRNGVRVLFVDYLTLIKTEEARDIPRHERIGQLAKGLKLLARELSIPVIALSQINRIGEGQMPGLENLRQSGEIEEDADLILLLHRKRDEQGATLRVAKNRRGPVGDVTLSYKSDWTLFSEVEHDHEYR